MTHVNIEVGDDDLSPVWGPNPVVGVVAVSCISLLRDVTSNEWKSQACQYWKFDFNDCWRRKYEA